MKFLCLGYLNERDFDMLPKPDQREYMKECPALCEQMRSTGNVVAEAGLVASKEAKTIRPRNRKPSVTDGPFLETKEQLGGFFIIDAEDINQAVAIAAKHPAAQIGEEYGMGIEVRPIQQDDIF